MKKINDKNYYTWKDYNEDIFDLESQEFDHVVGIYRGSLGLAAHVSNVYDVPMSIVGMQTRDSDDKEPYWIHNLIDRKTKRVLVVDDIYDTGNTMCKVINFVMYFSDMPLGHEVISYCLFGKANKDQTIYSQVHDGSWVVFPWEIID